MIAGEHRAQQADAINFAALAGDGAGDAAPRPAEGSR